MTTTIFPTKGNILIDSRLPQGENRRPFPTPFRWSQRRLNRSTRQHETDVPAQRDQAEATARIPGADGNQERTQGAEGASRQGPEAAHGLVGAVMFAPRLRFGRSRRLLLKREFDCVLRSPSLRLRRGSLVATVRQSGSPTARLGLIVAKRVLKRAVDRNRAKRIIRESFRRRPDLPPVDVVVRLALPTISAVDAERLFAALEDVLAKRNAAS